MSEKVEVRGDVAQLIGGNVNEAPHQSNVVNFHMGGDKTPVETLTDLQRKRIGGLVKDLCAITQEEPLDIYRVILTDFGAERMKDMPRAKYLDIVSQIERWIGENRQGLQTTSSLDSVGATPPVLAKSAPVHYCNACSEKDISYSRLQRLSRGQWTLSTILALVCGLLLYKMPSADVSTSSDHHCYFEGKPYTVGSTISTASGILRECMSDKASNSTTWIQAK